MPQRAVLESSLIHDKSSVYLMFASLARMGGAMSGFSPTIAWIAVSSLAMTSVEASP
jgi:hypothetical protein